MGQATTHPTTTLMLKPAALAQGQWSHKWSYWAQIWQRRLCSDLLRPRSGEHKEKLKESSATTGVMSVQTDDIAKGPLS